MIKKELEDWLRSIFELPVFYFKGQEISEKAIYYTLVGAPIETRITDDGMAFMYKCTVMIRVPIDSDYIGWLTGKLNDNDGRIDNMAIELLESAEIIEDVNKNHEVISKTISVTHDVSNNKIKEKIKSIDLIMH
jgi:hypothetical protein